MILTGDVAIASGDIFRFQAFPRLTAPVCVNLEGAAVVDGLESDVGVYNTHLWTDSLAQFNLGPIFIGNNHITDVPNGIELTEEHAASLGLRCFGAGKNLDRAREPVLCSSAGTEYQLIGFGWPVIGCRPATTSSAGVSPLEGNAVRSIVADAAQKRAEMRTVVVLHGNYEFELYPQPGHRRLSRELIDLGAYAVIWHHPHLAGPIERYRGHTIAYSLGNFAFSYGRFFGGRLQLPASSFRQVMIELSPTGDMAHHCFFEPPNTVRYLKTESIGADDLELRAEFEGLSDEAYEAWFLQHRKKRRWLPVYNSSDRTPGNMARDRWVAARQFGINMAVRTGIKSLRK